MMLKRKNKYFVNLQVPFLLCPLFQLETIVQLTLDQHRFELHESTYTQVFSNSKCYITTPPAVG